MHSAVNHGHMYSMQVLVNKGVEICDMRSRAKLNMERLLVAIATSRGGSRPMIILYAVSIGPAAGRCLFLLLVRHFR